jgi:hypothetical protein
MVWHKTVCPDFKPERICLFSQNVSDPFNKKKVILKNPFFIVSANCDEIAKEAFIIEILQPDTFLVDNGHALRDKVFKQG